MDVTGLINEAKAIYSFHIPKYIGTGKLHIFFLASLLLILFWRKKDRLHKGFSAYIVILSLLVFFPLLLPVYNTVMAGDYWRCLWFLTAPLVTGFALTILVCLAPKKYMQAGLTCLLLVLIFFSGIFQFNAANFRLASNPYKVPQDVIEICDIIHERVEDPKLASPGEVNFRVRQYDATIESESSRNDIGNAKLAALMNPEGEYDMEAIAFRAVKRGCNCVVLRDDRLPAGQEQGTDGMVLLGITGPARYHVYYLKDSDRGGEIK